MESQSNYQNVMSASMNLMRRLPPNAIVKNLSAICEMIQNDDDLRDDVMVKTDQPLETATDEENGEPFLKCEYNKDTDSYRSPWSNQYFPPINTDEAEDPDYQPIYPSSELLEMEINANEVFKRYAQLYYDKDFLTSVYFFDVETSGFGSCWLVKKSK